MTRLMKLVATTGMFPLAGVPASIGATAGLRQAVEW